MPTVHEILTRLRRTNCDPALIQDVEHALTSATLEETEGRIIRTNKGALMVRLSPDRWPIGMYAKDWRILINLVQSGAIESALNTMGILEENPQKSARQVKQIRAAEAAEEAVASGSIQVADRSLIDRDEEEAA